MKTMKSIILSLAVLVFLAGCQTNQEKGQAGGAVLGGVIGAILGKQAGDNKGALLGAVLGATAGALIGGEIGQHLDEKDREMASQNTQNTLAEMIGGQKKQATRKWVSPDNEGVSGQATASLSDISGCFDVMEMATIPGKGEVRQSSRYCQDSQGQMVKV